MGRIQRKKPAKKKKQRIDADSATQESGDSGASESKVALVESSAKEARRKPALEQRKPSASLTGTSIVAKSNFLTAALQFLREVKIELKKVTWPSRKQTIGSTAVVIVLVIIIALFLGIVDVGLSTLIRVVLQ
jgi:preprotein translocase subunit SecE